MTTLLAQPALDGDDELASRLRDLALVEIDALTAGLAATDAQVIVAEFADDVAEALREARTRIASLRQVLSGSDPLKVLDLPVRQRASDVAQSGAAQVRNQLGEHAEAARALAKLAALTSGLIGKLFEADRRR